MNKTQKFLVIVALVAAPLVPAYGTEAVRMAACSRPGVPISFTDLTTEGSVVSGAAVIPKGSDVSFSVTVKDSVSPGTTTLKAYSVVSGIPTSDYVRVTSGDLADLSDLKLPSSSRTFVLTAPSHFPSIAFTARLSIRNAGNEEIGCFEFPAKYVNAST